MLENIGKMFPVLQRKLKLEATQMQYIFQGDFFFVPDIFSPFALLLSTAVSDEERSCTVEYIHVRVHVFVYPEKHRSLNLAEHHLRLHLQINTKGLSKCPEGN